MDIYKYAESINYAADYIDMSTGYVYKIQDYGRSLKFGFPSSGIAVYNDSTLIGYARKNN